MSSDRFNKAARDGYLDALKEATRKDLNQKDEDGMTPTLWASFEGNLDALRLIVGRGGDPDKCDNYGNTALHFASARGHLHCVTFLVNFGVNMWALDIDFHTPKDLAAINNKEEILRFLDAAIAKVEASEPKKVKSYKEKASKEAEKRVKKFDELQKKASKSAQEQQKKLQKSREKMEKNGGLMGPNIYTAPGSGAPIDPMMTQSMSSQQKQSHYPGLPFITSLRKDTKALQSNSGSHSFSELTSSTNSRASKTTGSHTGVYKKILQQKSAKAVGSDFKVGDVTDTGKRSVRSLSGLRRDNEVMYVPKYEITSANNIGKRGKITGLFEENENGRRPSRTGSEPEDNDEDENPNRLTRSSSQPDYIHKAGVQPFSRSEESTSLRDHTGGVSIFERPGFGSVAFRKNMTSSLNNFASLTSSTKSNSHHHQHQNGSHRLMEGVLEEEDNDFHRDSIGSASSLNGRNPHAPQRIWDDDGVSGDEELEELDGFLAAANLMDYANVFAREKIDLEALLLLTDADFKQMGIELGPRRKLINAIEERHRVMENPGEVIDSRL